MDVGQFLSFCFSLSLGTCLPKIALGLVVLVKTNDKRWKSPLFSTVKLLWEQLCFKPVEIHIQPGVVP